ncbi:MULTISPECIES: DUF4250 domain-containing protein [Shewanella]|uniref:DUF4250 domain-containing protein n=1 Tax=Shewanella fidelis TaxID=173509 RepID=A0AAW8NJI8_9GAMM|nr:MULTISPECIES: DUF4250 domain-containing protein [Shewanella]MDR8523378.1 DUF4250 domain-containing protein [Shewanella fidelis]MDW4813388.1 DUF4250 domain-containing protein [Shewanella fidelis]MDW4817240.1 DUF4250 domain-containing protein [Shewanella fidelis]MDW4821403.1 DUF4250 domain-containing protein [Shewanella fidelis]MDW4824519.1 DUF4250 domain-containing protein [Shewanella fidelis]
MHIDNLSSLPVEILLGIANEQLRLNCKDKAALFYDLDINSELLEQKLAAGGYEYDPTSNQYKIR